MRGLPASPVACLLAAGLPAVRGGAYNRVASAPARARSTYYRRRCRFSRSRFPLSTRSRSRSDPLRSAGTRSPISSGLLLGWRYCLALADRPPRLVRRRDIDDFLVWATLGVVLGGRLGYVLFYNSAYYLAHPIEALYLWHGGMSFHGGAIGVTLAIWLFCRTREHPAPGLRRHHLRGGADRAVLRSDREFHQRRAVRARDRSALGGRVSGRRAAAAPSEPALRGRCARGCCCSCCC